MWNRVTTARVKGRSHSALTRPQMVMVSHTFTEIYNHNKYFFRLSIMHCSSLQAKLCSSM